MDTNRESKLKRLLSLSSPGTVLLASWLERQGISRDLQTRYRRSGWLESVGPGAFYRLADQVTWHGALHSLQQQAGLPIHAGALTALSLRGFAHYLRLGGETVYLLSPRGTKLPKWFKTYDWAVPVKHLPTSMLPDELGLEDYQQQGYSVRIAGPERAMLECLHLAPRVFDLSECFQVMEGLGTLRPDLVSELLEACTSIKAKRLFLYMAEKANHQWLRFVDTADLDLGSGERSLSKGGVYIPKYHLVVPAELSGL